ncbi:MAG: oligosaccharide flippase family protein [Fusobacteriaceae bacterium]
MKLVKNYIYNLISIVTGILFPFFTFPYISRVLGPEYFGKISFIQSFISYFGLIAAFGASGYALKELSRVKSDKETFSEILSEIVLICFATSLISFISGVCFMLFNNKVYSENKLFLILLVPVLFSFMSLDYIFIISENHRRRTIRVIILRIISIILILSFVKEQKDYILYGVILTVPEILARVVDFISIRKNLQFNFNFKRIKKHLKTMVFIFGFLLSSTIYVNIDTTMIGYMSNDYNVGLYSTSSKLVKIVVPIICCLGTILYPRIVSSIKEKKEKEVVEFIELFFKFTFFIGIPVLFLFLYNSKTIINLISGEQYLEAYKIMNVLIPTVILSPIAIFMGAQILTPNNQEKIVLKVSIVAVFTNVILNFIFIPKFIGIGAAIATLITEFIVCFYRCYEVKKIYKGFSIRKIQILCYIFSGIISLILTIRIEKIMNINSNFEKIYTNFSIFGIIYIFGLFLFKEQFITEGFSILNQKLKKVIKI